MVYKSDTYTDIFEELKDQKIIFFDIDERFALKVIGDTIKTFVANHGMAGVIVCLCRPADYIIRILENMDIPTDGIYYVDAIGKLCVTDTHNEIERHVTRIDIPFDITKLVDCIEKTLTEIAPQNSFVLIDDVTSMLLYWDENRIKRFLVALRKITENQSVNVILLTPTICKIKKLRKLKSMIRNR